MNLGAHVSTAGGVSNAPLNAKNLGITTFQIFSRNQKKWQSKPLTELEIDQYRTNCAELEIQETLAHGSYLINLANPDEEKRKKSIDAFYDEMYRADLLNIDYLVVHPGAHMGSNEEQGLRNVVDSLLLLLDRQSSGHVRILLETTAGQGTNLGYKFEHLAEIIQLVDHKERLGVCLDTCHAFTAGYDFRTRLGYENVFLRFDEIIGLEMLFAFHLNDSMHEFNSRKDRHAHIGEGEIGIELFGFLMNDERFNNTPGILETPKGPDKYKMNLDVLQNLSGSDT